MSQKVEPLKCIRCEATVHNSDFCRNEKLLFCNPCKEAYAEYKDVHFKVQLPPQPTAAPQQTDRKLHQFFSVSKKSKRKGAHEIPDHIDLTDLMGGTTTAAASKKLTLEERAENEERINPHKAVTMSQQAIAAPNLAKRQLSKQKTKKRKSYSVNLKRKRVDCLKLTAPITDPKKRQQVTDSFAWAFFAKQMKYTDKLVYDHAYVKEHMNDAPKKEPKMQKLDKESEEVLHKFRERESQGVLPPLLMCYDGMQGFYVKAATDLPEFALLAEYLGQVRTDQQTMFDTNDSIMELLTVPNRRTESLVVVPYSFANVARFFNGINNSDKDSKRKKQNVRTMRCQVDGKATVLLFTKRAVKAGEVLMFDYNEAGKGLYPTEHFV